MGPSFTTDIGYFFPQLVQTEGVMEGGVFLKMKRKDMASFINIDVQSQSVG